MSFPWSHETLNMVYLPSVHLVMPRDCCRNRLQRYLNVRQRRQSGRSIPILCVLLTQRYESCAYNVVNLNLNKRAVAPVSTIFR